MSAYYVGLDVHSRESVFAIARAEGAPVAHGRIPTTPDGFRELQTVHGLPPGTPVALETGTLAFYAARELARLQFAPVVIDAREVRLKVRRPRQKTDRGDAWELCDGLRRGFYRCLVHVPNATMAALRETISRRRHFRRLQAAEINAAKHLLRAAGLTPLSRNLRSPLGWQKLLLAVPRGTALHTYLAEHQALWVAARTHVATLERLLTHQRADVAEAARQLETIPGVGPIVALTVIGAFADVARFPSAKHIASYAGLVPAMYQSGDCDRRGHITKQGPAELRAMLCQAAQHAARASHPLHPVYAKVCARRGHKRALIAVAHKLCRIAFALLRDHTDFDPAKAGIEEGVFQRTVTHRYRLAARHGH